MTTKESVCVVRDFCSGKLSSLPLKAETANRPLSTWDLGELSPSVYQFVLLVCIYSGFLRHDLTVYPRLKIYYVAQGSPEPVLFLSSFPGTGTLCTPPNLTLHLSVELVRCIYHVQPSCKADFASPTFSHTLSCFYVQRK